MSEGSVKRKGRGAKNASQDVVESVVEDSFDVASGGARKVPVWPLVLLFVLTWGVVGYAGWYVFLTWNSVQDDIAYYEKRIATLEVRSERLAAVTASIKEDVDQWQVDEPAEAAVRTVGEGAMLSATRVSKEDAPSLPFEAVDARLIALEAALESQVAKKDQHNTLLLVLLRFKEKIYASEPFMDELVQVNQLAGEVPEIQAVTGALEPYARSGVIAVEALEDRFEAVARDLVVYTGTSRESGGFWDKVKSNIRRVITIRRIGSDVEGNSVEAIVARAEAALDEGNVGLAVHELELLKPEQLTYARSWLEEAKGVLLARRVFAAIEHYVLDRAVVDASGVTVDTIAGE